MIDSIKQMDCTGCKMCKDICPVEAISYECDREGFWYPKVDYDKCIKCGKCVRTCPSLSELENPQAKEPNVYAAWALDDEIRLKSTSGGIFYILAEQMLQQNGLIAACKYTADFKAAYHTVGNTKADLEAFKGSKYFQSDTEGIYKSVREQLKAGSKVLFCGAPCQVAALNRYATLFSDKVPKESIFTSLIDEMRDIFRSEKIPEAWVKDMRDEAINLANGERRSQMSMGLNR